MRKLYSKIKDRKNVGILLLISILIVTGISFGGTAYAADSSVSEVTFAGGSGTEADPYIIETAEQLDAVRNNLNAAYKLNADIEFTEADFAEGGKFYNNGEGWKPIGTNYYGTSFKGIFDGNGHVIRNIVINSSADCAGFFGSCRDNAKIMNMGIENGDVKGSYFAGGIVGNASNAEIEKCYYTGTVSGSNYIGGIAGVGEPTIRDCYNAASLTGNCVGGIAGRLASGEISSCYNIGNIKAGGKAGEIAGSNEKGSITNCYYIEALLPGAGSGTDTATACSMNDFSLQSTFTGFDFDTVWTIDGNGEYRFPALRGLSNGVTFGRTENFTEFAGGYGIKSSPYIITNTQQLNNVRNYPDASFKLADDIEFTSSDFASGGAFYNEGKGWEPIASFAGTFDGDGHVIKGLQCERQNDDAGLFGYSSGTITGLGMVNGTVKGSGAGGICAGNRGLISRCYNTCTVTGSAAGGIAGYNQGIIKDCYNSGMISGGAYAHVGGITGRNNSNLCEIINCYNIGKIGCGRCRGSIVGSNYNNAVITGCYYSNIGIKASYHSENNDGAISLADLRNQETYAGFDFDNTWTIVPGAGYWLPTLKGIPNYAVAPVENTTDFAGGYGTYDSPYLIKTTQQLDNIRKDLCASYRLENDITFEKKEFSKIGVFYNEGKRWEPIGSEDTPFYGNLDGNGYCIKGLIINRPDEYYCALFSYTYGEIKNLRISEFDILAIERACIAAMNYGIIDGCSNVDSIKFDATLLTSEYGDFAEYNGVFCSINRGTIRNCYNLGNVEASGYDYTGGIASVNNGIIKQCYNAGKITVNNDGAGIVARNYGKIYDCYNTGDIKAGGYAGGIAADSDGDVTSSYNIAAVRSLDMHKYEGGIVGYTYDDKTENSYSLDTSETYNAKSRYGNICTIDQMMKKETYKGFDFENVWDFDESGDYGLPILRGVNNYAAAPAENTTDFAGGYGTKSKPYIIENKTQLNNVRKKLNACYKLNSDIAFSASDFAAGGIFYNDGKGWEPIGDAENIFAGTFDGKGHTISGLKVTRNDEKNIGLFGCLSGTVKNTKISDCSIGGKTNIGSIAGYVKYGKITNCETAGVVTAYGKESDSYGEYCAGGIAGVAYYSKIADNVNYATVNDCNKSGRTYIGGIVGDNSLSSEISNCCNYGLVKILSENITANLGGIVGSDNRGNINLCCNAGEIQGLSGDATAGGLVGHEFYGTVTNSYNIGDVTSKTVAGGIIGEGRFQISGCYNAGKISVISAGEDDEWREGYAGGISGSVTFGTDVDVTKCYNIGSVTSVRGYAGAIIGRSSDDSDVVIATCYNIGEVSCPSGNAGGIAGESTATISDCFYLDNISKGVGSGTDAATKCSSAAMQNQETYGDAFDFDYDIIWAISGTAEYKYPVLTEVVNPELQYTLSLDAKQGVPEIPVAVSYGNGKITVNAVSGQKYVCVPDNKNGESGEIPALSSSEWKNARGSALIFEGLEQGKTYKVYTYIPAIGSKNASYVSQPLVVTLEEAGDLSSDGKIDSSDALYLRRALAGWDGYKINFSAADINIDGKIDIDDVMTLERHIAGRRGYEKLPVVGNADE